MVKLKIWATQYCIEGRATEMKQCIEGISAKISPIGNINKVVHNLFHFSYIFDKYLIAVFFSFLLTFAID